ncbi:Uncharacterised protein [uncultured archaeon]|nr:Uncharacterised protein [uncultured archaeon]
MHLLNFYPKSIEISGRAEAPSSDRLAPEPVPFPTPEASVLPAALPADISTPLADKPAFAPPSESAVISASSHLQAFAPVALPLRPPAPVVNAWVELADEPVVVPEASASEVLAVQLDARPIKKI